VVDLLQRDPGCCERRLHGCRVLEGGGGVLVQWLDEHTAALRRQPRPYEGLGIGEGKEAGFDPNAAREQQVAQLDNPRFALIRRYKIRQHVPGGDHPEAFLWIGDDRCGRGQGDREARGVLADGPEYGGDGLSRQGFLTGGVKGMDVY
jgi:hypothetical protein